MSTGSPRSRIISWSCEQCTLDNSVAFSTNGCYVCQLCNEPYAEDRNRPFVSPTAVISRVSKTCATKTSSVLDSHIIDLVAEDELSDIPNTPTEAKRESLAFSVSKNTGRITVHKLPHGGMVFNFDLHDILTNEALDELSDSKMDRRELTKEAKNGARVFDQKRKKELAEQLNSQGIEDSTSVFDFVISFLELSEAEKKFLRDSDETMTSEDINSTVARLMTTERSKEFNRYVGGAKERARENQEKGIASEADQLVLQGIACAWCAKTLSRASLRGDSTYCTEECARNGRLKRGGMFSSSRIRMAAFAIENGRCSLCRVDAHALYRQICALHPAERLNKLLSAHWKLPTTATAIENFLQNPKECQFWQVDHKIAVAEGGGGCGLENLRTLCVPCHQRETEKLRSRLKIQNAQISASQSGQQLDIREAFRRQI